MDFLVLGELRMLRRLLMATTGLATVLKYVPWIMLSTPKRAVTPQQALSKTYLGENLTIDVEASRRLYPDGDMVVVEEKLDSRYVVVDVPRTQVSADLEKFGPHYHEIGGVRFITTAAPDATVAFSSGMQGKHESALNETLHRFVNPARR